MEHQTSGKQVTAVTLSGKLFYVGKPGQRALVKHTTVTKMPQGVLYTLLPDIERSRGAPYYFLR